MARSAPALTLLVTALGAVASAGGGVVVYQAQQRMLAQAVEHRVALIESAVRGETGRYLAALRSVAAAAGAFDTLTAVKFGELAGPLRSAGMPGVTSIAFFVPATDEQVGPVQQQWRQRGAPGLVLHPVGTGREHIFSIFSEPFDGVTAAATGIDVTQAAAPTAALLQARDTGTVAVSDTYQLIRDMRLPPAQRQQSFVLTAPVYAVPDPAAPVPPTGAGPPDADPAHAAGRDDASAFRGWVLMGLRGQDFIGGTLQQITQGSADVTLQAVAADGRLDSVAALEAPSRRARTIRRDVEVTVAQRRWRLHLDIISAGLPGAGPAHVATTGAGLGLTALVAALVAVLATGRRRADARIAAATAQLRAAETEAREQAGLLTAVLDSVSDGVGVVDERGAFLLHNPAAQAMLGVDDRDGPHEWQAHYGLFHADGVTPFPADELPLTRALRGQSSTEVPMVVRNSANPDGIVITVSARPLHPTAGRPGAVAVFHDVTARTAAERQLADATDRLRRELDRRLSAEADLRAARDDLAAQQQYLREVLDTIDVTVVTCGTDGLLVHANRAARAALPDSAGPLDIVAAARQLRFTHPDGSAFTDAETPLARALRGEHVDGVEAHVVHADGTRHVTMLHARPLHGPDGRITGAVASSYSITALREREAELTAFAGIVAHDLKSPLSVITSYTDLLHQDLAERGDTEHADLLDRVLITARRMSRLIDDLLGYAAARDATLSTTPVELGALVEEVVTERLAAAGVPGTPPPQICVGPLPTLHADPALLRQLFDNLIGNAVKYTPPGRPGQVTITAEPHGDGHVRIVVADRGIGIPDGQHDAIFTGFHRAHRAAGYTGTGLGLAICQRVVHRHGGTITATDNPGGGARFTVTLPTTSATEQPTAGAPDARPHHTTTR
ncbi:ATP-binding protein [Dactylosporangium matsuzakiense]|uniref:ATP-binding protein n=1 Tax=Dactylosporangium matsuzakiense TaxID=53360 RepID=UPI0022F3459D|nr:ATP-binding protein [Dactylosporangium matsuzakiense]